MAAIKNFSYSTVAVAPSPATSGTSVTVSSGQGALFAIGRPAVVYPSGLPPLSSNAEIWDVTNIVGDVLTITRAQEGTSGRTVLVGDQVAQIYSAAVANGYETTLAALQANTPAFVAKGDLIAGASAGVGGIVSVGADGTVLTADAASTDGVKWATPAGGGNVSGPGSSVDGNITGFNGTSGTAIKDLGTPAVVIVGAAHAATGKTTPVDADELPLVDSAASNVLKKLTWANLKSTLKSYFDALYPSGSGTSTGTNTGDQTSVTGNSGTATALATPRNIDGQAFDGTANITVIAPGTHAATGKTTPVDADELPLVDSAASNVLKKLTWANLKATAKTYFDTLYPSGSGTSSGTNTGDQTITLTGDVTGSGTGSFVATVANAAVTLAKMANMATGSLFYRKTSGSGAPEVQTLATLKTDLGLTGTNSGDQTITLTGDVTGSGTGSFAATIAANAVTNGKSAQMVANTVKSNATASTADPSDLAMSASTILARLASGNIVAATVAQIKTLLAYAFSDLSGSVAGSQMPALTGDVTMTAGTTATTLAAGNAGNLNSGTLLAARIPYPMASASFNIYQSFGSL